MDTTIEIDYHGHLADDGTQPLTITSDLSYIGVTILHVNNCYSQVRVKLIETVAGYQVERRKSLIIFWHIATVVYYEML